MMVQEQFNLFLKVLQANQIISYVHMLQISQKA